MKNYSVLNKKNKWICGYYRPTEVFKHMTEHFCVMDAKNGTLVAITGENSKSINKLKKGYIKNNQRQYHKNRKNYFPQKFLPLT